MDEWEIQRQLGANSARIAILERNWQDVQATLGSINNKIDSIKTTVDSSRGGWRAVAWFVGVTGSLATLLTTLYHIGVIR